MKAKPTAREIAKLLDYDPKTGLFRWRRRPRRLFSDDWHWRLWNKRFCGKVAGNKNARGYVYINIEPKAYLAHRLAWLLVHGTWPKRGMDHINGCCDDNRMCNLRAASQAENCQNQKRRKNNTSGFIGVTWHSQRERWAAQIHKDGKKISLGLYSDINEAHRAYVAGKRNLHTFHPTEVRR